MSLRIDLIRPEEQRSASPVGLKLAGRLAGTCVIAGVSAFMALNIIAVTKLRREMQEAKAKWAQTEPRKEAAAKLMEEVKEDIAINEELKGWHDSRLSWSTQLLAVARLVPPEVQLTGLMIQHDFQILGGKSTARAYNVTIDGRCSGRGSEALVQTLKESLQRDSVTGPLTELVEIPRFREDPNNTQDRVFQITLKHRPRSM